MLKLGVLIILLLLAGIVGVGNLFLPWWGTLLLFLGALAVLTGLFLLAVRMMLDSVFRMGFDVMSRVLNGATVNINRVTTAEAPRGADDDEDVSWVRIDFSVTPDPDLGPPTDEREIEMLDREWNVWDAALFALAAPDLPPLDRARVKDYYQTKKFAAPTLIEILSPAGEVERSRLYEPDDDNDDSGVKGPGRVRLTIGIPDGFGERAVLRYGVHEFAGIELPSDADGPRVG